ncbi:MAG: cupin domain-containing protein [Actinobacteria bacterium]|nr:cupin domain-containing protein [Actinomycetota bacterium]
MPFQVLDYRTDTRNVVITPEIRARFLRLEPGQAAQPHSHDLGHEVFLVLQGRCEFTIEGHRETLGPGQLCFAARDQLHSVRCVSDEPVIMYLSVTPHIEPTHTRWDEAGRKRPPEYGHATRNERAVHDPSAGQSTDALADGLHARTREAALALERAAHAQASHLPAARQALAAADSNAAKAAADAVWSDLYPALRAVRAMEAAWNEYAARFTGAG